MVKEYIREFTRCAMEQNLSSLAFYLKETEGRTVAVYEGACEKLEFSQQTLLFVEGEYEGFCGSVFIENFDTALIEEQISSMKESALARKKPFLPYEYPDCEKKEDNISWMPLDQLLEKLCEAEKTAYQSDERIVRVAHCSCRESREIITMMDHLGHSVSDSNCRGDFHFGLGAKEGEEVQLGVQSEAFLLNQPYPDFSLYAAKAAYSASSRLGAGSYSSGNCPVLLSANVVCQLLDAFMPALFAKNMQNHMSVLEGKLSKKIAGENVILREEPQMEGGLCCRRFDDEGVRTKAKVLIDKGVFTNCLYNRQSAKSDGTVSGGNGFKASFSDEVDTAYTNVLLQPGDKSREELLKDLEEGLLIDDVSGVFAGANPVSGDFSLIAKGYQVQQGKVGRGIVQITIAGNFFDVICRVKALGSSLEKMSSNRGCVYCPDLLVEELMISGS